MFRGKVLNEEVDGTSHLAGDIPINWLWCYSWRDSVKGTMGGYIL